MRITGLEVDGFGIWSGLELDDLSDGLCVLFGPNEAGKTTLMQFIRSVLYGFTPERRRFLPPVHGGRSGGSLRLAARSGRFQVTRHCDPDDLNAHEELVVSGWSLETGDRRPVPLGSRLQPPAANLQPLAETPDGAGHGPQQLNALLCDIDEQVFTHVFAVGLDELHELAILDGTEAASLLYSLSAGMDRVALVDVFRELERSRNRLLSPDGQPGLVTQLLAEREKIQGEIDQLEELTHRYLRLVAERDQIERETRHLEEQAAQSRQEARTLEIAITIADRWAQQRKLEEQLAALGPLEAVPEGAAERLDAVAASLEKVASRMCQWKHHWDSLRAEAAELKINEPLFRLAPRIEALAEQESWIASLETRSAELESQISNLETELAAEQERLGLGQQIGLDTLGSLSPRSLRVLRGPAREFGQCRAGLREAEQAIATAQATAQSLAGQIEAALASRGYTELAEAMDRAGGLVAQLRRRVQLDERLEAMERHQTEMEERSRHLLQHQVLPAWLLMGLGGVFVVSVMMVLAGLAGLAIATSIVGSFAWPLAFLGIAGLGAAVATKAVLERSNARKLEGCHKQIRMLQLQAREARQEREALDRQLSLDDGSVAARLAAAEADLAELEELVPLDARRKAAEQEAQAAAERVRQLKDQLEPARRRWRETLDALGLPRGLSPKQVHRLSARSSHVSELRRRLESLYEEYEARRGELESLTRRIAQLAADTGVAVQTSGPIEQLRALVRSLAEQEARLKRREALRKRARFLRQRRAKYQTAIRRLKRRRQDILRTAGARDEHDLRRRAAQAAQAAELRRRRESLQREIEAAAAGHCPLETLAELLDGNQVQQLGERRQQLEKRRQAAEAGLRDRLEKRGTLHEQLKSLAEDRRPAMLQLELAMVQKRLDDAIGRWRVLAAASQILQAIRRDYERKRQPETLREASGYLERLTEGRYVRVWTPLDRDVLLVDDAGGQPHTIELLSRGVREQLFLALRLALAGSFARRGKELPLLLDDVLVNFDGSRTRAAVALLGDFAAAGHQVLLFTCHEHIVKLFESIRVQVKTLPANSPQTAPAPAARRETGRRRRPRPQAPAIPHKLATEAEPARVPLVREQKKAAEPDVAARAEGHDPTRGSRRSRQLLPEHSGYFDDQASYDDHGVDITHLLAARPPDETAHGGQQQEGEDETGRQEEAPFDDEDEKSQDDDEDEEEENGGYGVEEDDRYEDDQYEAEENNQYERYEHEAKGFGEAA